MWEKINSEHSPVVEVAHVSADSAVNLHGDAQESFAFPVFWDDLYNEGVVS